VKGKTIKALKHSNDRKMDDRKILTSLCGLFPPSAHCFNDAKLYFSVIHFSVIAFAQANLTSSS
jgi:hypothetical protein